MEKQVFKISNTQADYAAGINQLVAHFNMGDSAISTSFAKEASAEHLVDKQSPVSPKTPHVHQKQLNSANII